MNIRVLESIKNKNCGQISICKLKLFTTKTQGKSKCIKQRYMYYVYPYEVKKYCENKKMY